MIAPVHTGEDLAVAGPYVYALGIKAVRVQAFAIDALVVAGTGQAVAEALPGLAAIPSTVHGELPRADAEVVRLELQRHHESGVGRALRDRDGKAVERGKPLGNVRPRRPRVVGAIHTDVSLGPEAVGVLAVDAHPVRLVDGRRVEVLRQEPRELLVGLGAGLLRPGPRHRVVGELLPGVPTIAGNE